MKNNRILYDVMIKTYKELNDFKKVPIGLRYRLNNINSRKLIYEDFIYYFNLENEYEAFKFILDDKNVEEIIRYSLGNSVMATGYWVESGYMLDTKKESLESGRSLKKSNDNNK